MKKNSSIRLLAIPALLVAFCCIEACSKDQSSENGGPGSQQLSVFLTDNPAPFEKVLVDIRSLEVWVDTSADDQSRSRGGDDNSGRGGDDDHRDDNGGRGGDDDHRDDNGGHDGDDDAGTWVNIPIRAGVYDLLTLRNGVDTLLGAANIPAGLLEKIRIGLGAGHSVVINGVSYPLLLGNAGKIIIKVDDDNLVRDNGRIRLHIDFDAGRSIEQHGSGFVLNPVLRSFCDDRTARVEGRVAPAAAFPVIVRIYNSRDTAMAIPDPKDGRFKVRGLPDGTYNIAFSGSNGYRDTILTNVSLSRTRDLKLPVVQLLK